MSIMKGLKLSKTSWLILSAGVFLVVLAGLGLTRSQQMNEQTKLDDELGLYEKRLGMLQTEALSQQLENLRGKVEEGEAQLKEAKARLNQSVVSVDVTDEFFKIAEYCSVNITNMSTTVISQIRYEGVDFSTISLAANVVGNEENVINFVNSLNNSYVTGNVQSAQISIAEATEGEEVSSSDTNATLSMIVYSYEGM
jgi:hypothetical protein